MRTVKCKRWSTLFGTIPGAVAVICLVGVSAGFAPATQIAQNTVSSAAPMPAQFSRIGDLLRRLQEKAKEAKKKLNEGITPANKAAVLALLDDIEFEIDTLLDPLTDPSLTPATAGDVLSGFDPQTVFDYADDVEWLAIEAHDENLEPIPSHVWIGSYVKTIDAMLDDYRQAVNDA